MNRALVFVLALTLSLSSALVACGSAANTESAGALQAPLSSVGPDGALYSLPQTAVLTLTGASGPQQPVTFANAPGPRTFSVPAGTYTAALAPGLVDGGTAWALTRSADGGTSVVSAILVDPQPYTVTVTAGATTPLAFHFEIETLGSLSFGTGGLATSVQLDAGTFPASRGTFTGAVALTTETLNGSASLDAALKLTSPASISYALSVTRTGPWTVAAEAACALVSVTTSAKSSNANVAALVQEVNGGTGQLCFSDASRSGEVDLYLSRTGLPVTPAMQSALPAGGTFEVRLSGYTLDVFDDTSLALGSLPEPFTVTSAALATTVSAGGAVLAVLGSSAKDSATGTLSP